MLNKDPHLAGLVKEQIAYYDARAADWDTYADFGGPYPGRPERNRIWFADVRLMRQELTQFSFQGNVLELAAGTGMWSEQLAETASAMTVLDASPAMLDRNRQRCADICMRRKIPYRAVCEDIFEWQPDARYDGVFFAFWLCHIPPPLFRQFWTNVPSFVKTGGRLLFFDVRSKNGVEFEDSSPISTRALRSGLEFRVVKVRYPVKELEHILRQLGINAHVRECGEYGLVGDATFGDRTGISRSARASKALTRFRP